MKKSIGRKRQIFLVSATTFVIITLLLSSMVVIIFPQNTAKQIDNVINTFPPGWTDDIQMTLLTELGSQIRPALASEGEVIHLIWENRSSIHKLEYRRSNDAGRTWTETRMITSGEVGNQKIAINGSQIHVVYEKDFGIGLEIVYQNSTDNGDTWNAPVMLTPNDGIWTQLPDIAVINDTIHIVWEDEGTSAPGSCEIFYRNSTDGGISWNPTIQLTNYPGGSDTEAKIAVNGSIVHITWGRFVTGTGTFEAMYRRSLDGGSTWEAEKQISLPGSGHSEPSDLAVNGSSVYTIWMDSRDGSWETYINSSFDNGQTWNGEMRLTDADGRNSFGAHVGTWDQTVYVVWGDPRDDYPYPEAHEAYMNYSFDGGVTWQSSNERLQFALNNSGPGDIALTENSVHVVMTDNRTGKKEIYYKRYPDFPADIASPSIIHTPTSSTPIGQSINITAKVTDNVALADVWLNYTSVNGTNNNVSMTGWNQKEVMVSGLGQTLYAQDGNYSFEIPAQQSAGVMNYYIWTNDTSGNENWIGTYQVQIFDMTKPIINHVPVASSKINEPIDIGVNVTDNGEVANVTLYYENVGVTTYTAVDMTPVSGNWAATIPAQNETGLAHYFIWANDTSGNNVTDPLMGSHAVQITGPPSIGVTNPVGGEDWTGGSKHLIEFVASDTEDNSENLTVFLNYTFTTGQGDIAISIKGDESPYLWTLPNIDATDVVVNATVVDSDGNKTYDDSPIFTIDSSPPEVISTNPVNNTTGISIFQPIVIQFNEKMNISSAVVNQTNGTDPGGWFWFWNQDKDTITGIHDAWLRGDNVEITVQIGYKDDSEPGNINNTAYVFSFTTETNPSPEINHMNISVPQELGDAIRINATITDDGTVMNGVLWWQDVDDIWHENYMDKDGDDWEYTIHAQMAVGKVKYQINATDDFEQKNSTIIYEFDIRDSTPPVIIHTPVESAVIGEAINITCEIIDLSEVNIAYMTSGVFFVYRYEGDTGFTYGVMNPGYWYELPEHSAPATIEYYIQASDIYGNVASTQLYTLEIIAPSFPDTIPPEILLATPTGDNIPISTEISIVFNEAMNQSSVENAISISPTITGISYTWLNNQTLVIDISGILSYNSTYTVMIDTGTKDLAGNTLENDYSWQFTTVEEPEIIQQPASNNWGWIGIIIFLATIIMLMLFYQFNKEKELE